LSFVPCLRHVDDEIGDQRPQFYYRGNLHEQCNIALHLKVIDFESDAQEQHGVAPTSKTRLTSPRTTTGKDIGRLRLSRLAIVATQSFRMTLPISANASYWSSMTSFNESDRPTTARISSRLLVSGKIRSARPENAPVKS
jgi:hypothetical protein